MKYRVNWELNLDGKVYVQGDEVVLTDEQIASLAGSACVTPLGDVPAETKKDDAEHDKDEAARKAVHDAAVVEAQKKAAAQRR
jgi:hypothetical protein